MRKLDEVEQAKALMLEAVDWSVMKWLREKKRVRKVADQANNALWAMQKEVKASWSDDLKLAYDELGAVGNGNNSRALNVGKAHGSTTAEQVRLLAKRVKQADEEADRAHMDAEATFDRAEKILSTSMAREGCRKAITSWDLYEKAIRAAEAGSRSAGAVVET